MVCIGLWNLYHKEKWYRIYNKGGRISPPDTELTLQVIKQLYDKPDDLRMWEPVPFRSPIHSSLDYVYTIDQDAGAFIISLWGKHGFLMPRAISISLSKIYESSTLLIRRSLEQPNYVFDDTTFGTSLAPIESLVSGTLDIDFGPPTPMNELQERFFTDFVYVWRFYIDDPLTWRGSSTVFNVLCIALLRLAAWDFELSSDYNVELPISFSSIPSWNYTTEDIYWFHGFLVVLQEDIESETMRNKALAKAKSYIADSLVQHTVRLIIISPKYIIFVQLLRDVILTSKCLSLLTNCSAAQCSPGFRALTRILTSNCWKKSLAYRERWQYSMPQEIFQRILCELEPRDTVAFAQASFASEQWYYASVPQLKNVLVQNYKSSIPCCGKRSGLEENGVCCLECYSWQHLECVGLKNRSSNDPYVCVGCQSSTNCTTLDPGGINKVSRRKSREGSLVKAGGSTKLLQLRLSKPSHLRPELRFLGNLVPIPPNLIEFTILFNCSFSGLAYGFEDRQ